jgi:hypothetical protein
MASIVQLTQQPRPNRAMHTVSYHVLRGRHVRGMSLILCIEVRRDPKNAVVSCWPSRSSRAFYAKVSWKGNRVTTLSTSSHLTGAQSVSRCRSTCLPTLRGNRDELHESGSALAFVMPRDAGPLAHRWFAGPARHTSTVLRSGCRSVSEQTLFCWSCIAAEANAGVHERLAQTRELRRRAGRTAEPSVRLTGVCDHGRWEQVRRCCCLVRCPFQCHSESGSIVAQNEPGTAQRSGASARWGSAYDLLCVLPCSGTSILRCDKSFRRKRL